LIEPLLLIGDEKASALVKAARGYGYETGVPAKRNGLVHLDEGIDGYRGVVVSKNDVRRTKDAVATYRPKVDLLIVDPPENVGAIARDDRVDALLGTYNRFFDVETLRTASRNGVSMLFDLSPVVQGGEDRYGAIKRLHENAVRCRETNCSAMITTAADDRYGVRASRDLKALAEVSGFTPEQAETALETPRKALEGGKDRG